MVRVYNPCSCANMTSMAIPRPKARLKRATAHPALVLHYEYLEPLGLSSGALAKAMGLSGRQRMERVVRGQLAITADTALRLSRVFPNTSPQFWLNLQAAHDLSRAQIEMARELEAIAPLAAP